jgi:hypothetical protein
MAIEGDLKSALSFVSPASYGCFDKPLTAAEGEKAFLAGLAKVRKVLGRRAELSDYLRPFIPDDPMLWLVNQPDKGAFAILSPPESAARSSMCNPDQKPYNASDATPSEHEYGRYYATAFLMKVSGGGEPVAFYTLWASEKDRWKMVSWQLLAP